MIFLISAMGMTINSHFCGMKLQSVSVVEKDCCCKKNSKMPKGCCKNEVKVVKITDDYSPSSQLHIAKTDLAPLAGCFVFNSSFVLRHSYFAFQSHSPPPKFEDIVITSHSLLI